MNNLVNYKVIFNSQGVYVNSVQQIDLICQPQGIAKQAVPRLYDTSFTTPMLVEKPNENTRVFLHIYNCDGTFTVVDETIDTFAQDYKITCSLCKVYPFGIDPNGDPNLYLNQTGNWTTPMTSGGLFAQTGNSPIIQGTTIESTLIGNGVGTLSVPANGFKVGDSYRAIFGGVLTTGNNQTIQIRIKSGNTILLNSTPKSITNITNNIYTLNIDFTIRQIGAAGTAAIVSVAKFNYLKTVNGSTEGFAFNYVNTNTFDTTINNTLDVTVQFGSNSVGNSIYSNIFVLNKVF